LEPYRIESLEGHPWAKWGEYIAEGGAGRAVGGGNRWNANKDMSFEPLKPFVVEVAYDHLQGDRFRHATTFRRFRPDRDPESCTYAQLDSTVPEELAKVFGA
jgi:ATP-dependent DNA ligase